MRRWRTDLAAPAVSYNAPVADIWVARFELLDDGLELLDGFGWCGSGLEKLSQSLAFVLGVRRVPGNVCRVALKPVGHEDLVLLVLIRGGEDIGTLESLGEEAKDVIDDQNALFGRRGASGICLEVSVLIIGERGSGVQHVFKPSMVVQLPFSFWAKSVANQLHSGIKECPT